MAEPIKTPTPEIYAREAEYVKSVGEHSKAFDAIIDAAPKDRQDIRDALQGLYHVEPGMLIDRDKMAKLKERNEPLYNEVNAFLTVFLERKINLAMKAEHREWLKKVAGTRVKQIEGAKVMQGLEQISLDGLVVSNPEIDWEVIKQPIIPVEPSSDLENESAKSIARYLRIVLKPQLNSQDAFLALVKDEQMGGEDDWALSIINPRDLKSTEENLRGEMESCYMAGQIILGNSTRAALLAISGKSSV